MPLKLSWDERLSEEQQGGVRLSEGAQQHSRVAQLARAAVSDTEDWRFKSFLGNLASMPMMGMTSSNIPASDQRLSRLTLNQEMGVQFTLPEQKGLRPQRFGKLVVGLKAAILNECASRKSSRRQRGLKIPRRQFATAK